MFALGVAQDDVVSLEGLLQSVHGNSGGSPEEHAFAIDSFNCISESRPHGLLRAH